MQLAVAIRAVMVGVATSPLLTAGGSLLSAQSTPPAAADVPTLRMLGAPGIGSMSVPGTLTFSLDKPGYVTVFAIASGRSEAPIEVIAPARPQLAGRLAAGQRLRSTPSSAQLVRLRSGGRNQLLVAFVSTVPPNLDAFRVGERWADSLVLTDSLSVGAPGLVKALSQLVFGDLASPPAGTAAPFRMMVQPLAAPMIANRYTGSPSASDCLTEIARLSWSPAFAANYGNSGEIRPLDGGSGGCAGYTVDWVAPAPAANYGRSTAAGGEGTTSAAPVPASGKP